MSMKSGYELEGVRVYDLKKHQDERGFFVEVLRQDWKEFLNDDEVMQVSLSMSQPGVVRAWHRHARGQVDYLLVIQGAVKIAVYDDREGSATCGRLVEIMVSEDQLRLVRIPGYYWHGTKSVDNKPSSTLYFLTRLYDYTDPDEERRPPDSTDITDPRTACPYDWDGTRHTENKEA